MSTNLKNNTGQASPGKFSGDGELNQKTLPSYPETGFEIRILAV